MRLRFAFLTVAALGLAGCATLPGTDGLTAYDVQRFSAGVEKAGCVIQSDAKAAIVEKHTGFSDEKLREVTRYMLDQKTLVHEDRGIKLVTGNCADA
ncbi:hypothetical protein [Lentibacter sp. XHP0401]|uniref:hypothetical protein n=1 Tax=Lentibacter sp. XHP0401 TaxID=2984334 RepID=UPI0021E736DA|nr:hypothetical protein [Lentibacter sp. XHP0401]MCV2893946.1 hypothetical protein [Lentibacter sp. XHP0401]